MKIPTGLGKKALLLSTLSLSILSLSGFSLGGLVDAIPSASAASPTLSEQAIEYKKITEEIKKIEQEDATLWAQYYQDKQKDSDLGLSESLKQIADRKKRDEYLAVIDAEQRNIDELVRVKQSLLSQNSPTVDIDKKISELEKKQQENKNIANQLDQAVKDSMKFQQELYDKYNARESTLKTDLATIKTQKEILEARKKAIEQVVSVETLTEELTRLTQVEIDLIEAAKELAALEKTQSKLKDDLPKLEKPYQNRKEALEVNKEQIANSVFAGNLGDSKQFSALDGEYSAIRGMRTNIESLKSKIGTNEGRIDYLTNYLKMNLNAPPLETLEQTYKRLNPDAEAEKEIARLRRAIEEAQEDKKMQEVRLQALYNYVNTKPSEAAKHSRGINVAIQIIGAKAQDIYNFQQDIDNLEGDIKAQEFIREHGIVNKDAVQAVKELTALEKKQTRLQNEFSYIQPFHQGHKDVLEAYKNKGIQEIIAQRKDPVKRSEPFWQEVVARQNNLNGDAAKIETLGWEIDSNQGRIDYLKSYLNNPNPTALETPEQTSIRLQGPNLEEKKEIARLNRLLEEANTAIEFEKAMNQINVNNLNEIRKSDYWGGGLHDYYIADEKLIIDKMASAITNLESDIKARESQLKSQKLPNFTNTLIKDSPEAEPAETSESNQEAQSQGVQKAIQPARELMPQIAPQPLDALQIDGSTLSTKKQEENLLNKKQCIQHEEELIQQRDSLIQQRKALEKRASDSKVE